VTEFERIDRFLEAFRRAGGRTQSSDVTLGPGDDAAILESSGRLAITTDAVVEHVHFQLDWCTPRQLGHKALAVNLSDLAAMGARPVAFTCAIATPRSLDDVTSDELAAGMGALAARHGAVLAGGNFTKASELSITITAIGRCEHGPLRRDGAKAGDALVLVGETGLAALQLQLVSQGKMAVSEAYALHEPRPRVEAGRILARVAHAAIDVSDGLVQDAGHVARASKVQLELEVDALAPTPEFQRLLALDHSLDDVKFRLAGGEDYGLLAAVPNDRLKDALEIPEARVVGRVRQGSGVHVVGLAREVEVAGHDHFR